jgi:hypothetical protein
MTNQGTTCNNACRRQSTITALFALTGQTFGINATSTLSFRFILNNLAV